MREFTKELERAQPPSEGRKWVFVSYDQLSDAFGPLAAHRPEELGIVLVEAPEKAALRPYHKQKLALVLANLRHFALEQAERGVRVEHVVARGSYAEALLSVAKKVGTLTAMVPAERELRRDIDLAVREGAVSLVPHAGWLTTQADFEASQKGPPWRMDAFYRHVRKKTGLLMKGGKPEGGKWSFDPDNRKKWPGTPAPPRPLQFVPDAITLEVGRLVEARFGRHPGTLSLSSLPASGADAERVWRHALEQCLPHFGPFEDAMSTASRRLFHSGTSQLINLSRISPARAVREAAAADAPLSSREGFVRQVLGWREFVRHVHGATDGFRDLPGAEVSNEPGDGGYAKWSGARWARGKGEIGDGGARPHALTRDGETIDVPPAFWGQASGLACVDRTVASVWDEGYSHHITRLMVLSNLATLLDVSPRALTDWFWVAYTDAYDWVVEPNVLAMGTFAAGEVMTTKPYVAGAAYIHKMSDHCATCSFDPDKDCPFTRLYWAFLDRNRATLADNQRMKLPLASAAKRAPGEKAKDRETFSRVRDTLDRGALLRPQALSDLAR